MGDWTGEPIRTLDELTAFDAMRRFLEIWWERGGRSEDQIGGVLSSLNRTNKSILGPGAPLDIALWGDWREAVSLILERGSAPDRDPLS
jgi:hypothetical protein